MTALRASHRCAPPSFGSTGLSLSLHIRFEYHIHPLPSAICSEPRSRHCAVMETPLSSSFSYLSGLVSVKHRMAPGDITVLWGGALCDELEMDNRSW